jgi:hypothetical protein
MTPPPPFKTSAFWESTIGIYWINMVVYRIHVYFTLPRTTFMFTVHPVQKVVWNRKKSHVVALEIGICLLIITKNCWRRHSWDPYPPSIGKRRQWGHPSPPRTCRHLKWMVPKLIFLDKIFFWKNSINFWHPKLTLKVRFWHFLTNRNPSKDLKKKKILWGCWFLAKKLAF